MRVTNNFGAAIREVRIGMGITLVELARRAGISNPYLSNIETGKNDPPVNSVIVRLESELGILPGVLFKYAIEDGFERIPPAAMEEFMKGID